MEEELVIPCSSNDGKAAAVARQAGAKLFNAKDCRVFDGIDSAFCLVSF